MAKILIVEDEERIRVLLADFLTTEGYETFQAADANDANEFLKKKDVDLVLLDIKMPDVDGGELYEIMQLFHKKVKVIVSSVYPVEEQRKSIIGACDYYEKSQGIDVLLSKIENALNVKSRTQARRSYVAS